MKARADLGTLHTAGGGGGLASSRHLSIFFAASLAVELVLGVLDYREFLFLPAGFIYLSAACCAARPSPDRRRRDLSISRLLRRQAVA